MSAKLKKRLCTLENKLQNLDKIQLKDVICPICQSILIRPVTLPCAHCFCEQCFNGSIENNALCCPLCRLRIGSWVRTATKQKSLVNNNLWYHLQSKFLKEIGQKLEGNDVEVPEEKHIPRLSAPSEIRSEYEAEIQRLRDERLQKEQKHLQDTEILIRKIQKEEEDAQINYLKRLKQDELLAKSIQERESKPLAQLIKNSMIVAKKKRRNCGKSTLQSKLTINQIDRYLAKRAGSPASKVQVSPLITDDETSEDSYCDLNTSGTSKAGRRNHSNEANSIKCFFNFTETTAMKNRVSPEVVPSYEHETFIEKKINKVPKILNKQTKEKKKVAPPPKLKNCPKPVPRKVIRSRTTNKKVPAKIEPGRHEIPRENKNKITHSIKNEAMVLTSAVATALQATSPEKKAASPEKKPTSPEKKPTSPEKRFTSPEKKPTSPEKKATSPEKKDIWIKNINNVLVKSLPVSLPLPKTKIVENKTLRGASGDKQVTMKQSIDKVAIPTQQKLPQDPVNKNTDVQDNVADTEKQNACVTLTITKTDKQTLASLEKKAADSSSQKSNAPENKLIEICKQVDTDSVDSMRQELCFFKPIEKTLPTQSSESNKHFPLRIPCVRATVDTSKLPALKPTPDRATFLSGLCQLRHLSLMKKLPSAFVLALNILRNKSEETVKSKVENKTINEISDSNKKYGTPNVSRNCSSNMNLKHKKLSSPSKKSNASNKKANKQKKSSLERRHHLRSYSKKLESNERSIVTPLIPNNNTVNLEVNNLSSPLKNCDVKQILQEQIRIEDMIEQEKKDLELARRMDAELNGRRQLRRGPAKRQATLPYILRPAKKMKI